jgi:radical SAM protein (TIGR01212 family)
MRLPYRSLNSQLQAWFGERVQKIPLDAGLLCPNKSGEISQRGCIFCDPYGSGYILHQGLPIDEQIRRFSKNRKERKFLAYLQAHCNTNAGRQQLEDLFNECLAGEGVCGLVVGTRPDCLPRETLDLLEVFASKTFLIVELGLQSSHERSLIWLNRNHSYEQFVQAFTALKERGIRVVVHLIVGLPGEGEAESCQTVLRMNELLPWGVKFHLLHVLRGTELFRMYEAGQVALMEQGTYVDSMITLLEWLHPLIGVHRLSADRDPLLFVAPQWAQHKTTVVNLIAHRMAVNDRWQGKRLGFGSEACHES